MADTKNTKEQQQRAIVKHPGGVILHLSDGSSEYFEYGRDVSGADLADYQRESLGRYTDDKDRTAYIKNEQNHQAHLNAATADAGQVNSTSDPIPGNYGELTEEEAAQLVMAITDPAVQARFVLHERLHGGNRQMVVDAAGPLAVSLADVTYDHIADGGHTRFDQTPVIDRERQIERGARKSAAEAREGEGDEGDSGKQSGGAARSRSGATPDPNA